METQDKPPLNDIRILDLADEKASFCSKLLADLGAHVIKVEKPGGDSARKSGQKTRIQPGNRTNLAFAYNNRNKFGVTLKLESSAGRQIFLKLLKNIDVLVESFPGGYLDELGLGFDVIGREKPGLIKMSVSGFGRTGPRKDFLSGNLVTAAFGGPMSMCGAKAMPPLEPYGPQASYTASLFAAVGILLALRKRKISGRGEYLDLSMQAAATATLEHVLVRYFAEQIVASRQGNVHWNRAFCVMPCKDGFIQLTPLQQWKTLVEWMDTEGMAGDLTDEIWSDPEYRLEHIDHILDLLRVWTLTHTRDELFELGQLMHFPWAPVTSPQEVIQSPQLAARDFFIHECLPESGLKVKFPGIPYKFGPGFSVRSSPAPFPGEDNRRVYVEELGLSEDEINDLVKNKVI
jgi:crotonobetainyl-CoA:carnitine CoA-transferase CaiB-like acyl-CoA transferase